MHSMQGHLHLQQLKWMAISSRIKRTHKERIMFLFTTTAKSTSSNITILMVFVDILAYYDFRIGASFLLNIVSYSFGCCLFWLLQYDPQLHFVMTLNFYSCVLRDETGTVRYYMAI